MFFSMSLLFRYSVIFRSTKAWIVLSLCWILCILVATVASITNEPSIWLICENHDSLQILLVEDDKFTLPISKFIFLFIVPLLLITLIYTRIYLAARANSEKLRLKTTFNTVLCKMNCKISFIAPTFSSVT